MTRLIPALVLILITSTVLVRGTSQSQPSPKITEIVLEAKGGFDPATFKSYGTVFKLTLHGDGMAFYYGKTNVKLIGNYQGTISGDEFEKLARFLIARRYLEIPDKFVNPSETTETAKADYFKPKTITTITYEGGQKTTWRLTELNPTLREQIPQTLFEIETAIVDTGARIKWREVE